MKIHLVGHDIISVQADILVSTVPSNKQLSQGRLSRYIYEQVGESVQTELNQFQPGEPFNNGQIVVTGAGNLSRKFKKLYFNCLSTWNGKNAEDIRDSVVHCCKMASQYKSIVFPCVGSGAFGYPEMESCMAIIEGLLVYIFDEPRNHLETVFISLFGKSAVCMKEWDNKCYRMISDFNKLVEGDLRKGIYYIGVSSLRSGAAPAPTNSQQTETPQKKRSLWSIGQAMAPAGQAPLAGTQGSRSLTPWLSLPSIPTVGADFGMANVHVANHNQLKVNDDGVELDLSLRLKLAAPWLKKLFGSK